MINETDDTRVCKNILLLKFWFLTWEAEHNIEITYFIVVSH